PMIWRIGIRDDQHLAIDEDQRKGDNSADPERRTEVAAVAGHFAEVLPAITQRRFARPHCGKRPELFVDRVIVVECTWFAPEGFANRFRAVQIGTPVAVGSSATVLYRAVVDARNPDQAVQDR